MADSTPLATATAFFTALQRQDWGAAAALADPEWAKEHRLRELAFLAVAIQYEEVQRSQDETSSASGSLTQVPDDSAAITELLQRFSNHPLQGLGERPITLGTLASYPPHHFLALYLQFLGSYRGTGSPPFAWQIIGELLEGDSLGYVLFRTDLWPLLDQPGEVTVLHLRRTADGWRYCLSRGQTGLKFGMMLPIFSRAQLDR
jgi:hypothetical protein